MAYGDYIHCDRCDCKVMYDESGTYRAAELRAVLYCFCKECFPFVEQPAWETPNQGKEDEA
jgi:hypothetical protein